MKKNYYYYIIAAILLVLILYYFFFRKEWAFEDNYFVEGGKLAFVGTEMPPFTKDEKINVTQAPGAKYNSYDGKAIVTNVVKKNGKFIVVTNKSRKGDSPVNPGIITS